jgi:hypothetical protein
MFESETFTMDTDSLLEGPPTPDEDETFGPEPDDPGAAGSFEDPYEVPDFDPALEARDICGEEVRG